MTSDSLNQDVVSVLTQRGTCTYRFYSPIPPVDLYYPLSLMITRLLDPSGVKAKENIGMWSKVNFYLQRVDIHKEIKKKISVNNNGGITYSCVCLCVILLLPDGPLCACSLCLPSSMFPQSFLHKFLGFHP